MAVLFFDGLDLYGSLGDMPLNFYTYNTSKSSIANSGGRFNGNGLDTGEPNQFNFQGLDIVGFGSVSTTVIAQGAFFAESSSGDQGQLFFRVGDQNAIQPDTVDGTGVIVRIKSTSAGAYTVEDSAGNTWDVSNDIPTARWAYFEMKVDVNSSNANIVLRIDEKQVLSVTGDTSQAGDATKVLFGLGYDAKVTWDDLIVLDTSGTENNDFLGDVRIVSLRPNADGDTVNYTPLNGGANFEEVDETGWHDGDTTYNSAGSVGDRDVYAFEDLGISVDKISAIQIRNVERKDGTGTRGAAPVVKSGTTVDVSSEELMPTSYVENRGIWEANPDTGSAWTKSEVNNLQAGYEVTT